MGRIVLLVATALFLAGCESRARPFQSPQEDEIAMERYLIFSGNVENAEFGEIKHWETAQGHVATCMAVYDRGLFLGEYQRRHVFMIGHAKWDFHTTPRVTSVGGNLHCDKLETRGRVMIPHVWWRRTPALFRPRRSAKKVRATAGAAG